MDGAVLIHNAGLESQGGLRVDGGHAEEGDDPHPEDGAGAAGEDGAGSAHDVAGTHLGGDGGSQRLERAHTAVVLLAVQGQIAEDLFHAFAEAADLDEAGLNGVPEANGHQQEHQDVVGQVRVDLDDDVKQCGFHRCEHNLFPSCKIKRAGW